MREQRQSGLARALFCVRLLEQRGESSPEQRLAFLVGAFLASDLDALISRGLLRTETGVVIAGGGPVAGAWRNALARASLSAVTLNEAEVEQALLVGSREIASGVLSGEAS